MAAWDIPLRMEHVTGDTWCIVTGYVRIPVYKLGDGRAVLMDSGLLVPDGEKLLRLLEKEGLRAAAVLTSHAHIDHIGSHAVLQRLHGALLYMTPFAAAVMASPLNMGAAIYNHTHEGVKKMFGPLMCRADRIIGEEERFLTVCGRRFGILRLPGHAPEHVGFVTPDGAAYVGDALLSPEVMDSIHLPFCMCPAEDIESRKRLAETDFPFYILAHNGVCTDVRAAAEGNDAAFFKKAALVLDLACAPVSLETLMSSAMAGMHISGDNSYKVHVAEQSLRAIIHYLVDARCLRETAEDGRLMYAKIAPLS